MRAPELIFYLLPVLLIVPEVFAEVGPGHIYELNLVVKKYLSGTSWVGIYGNVGTIDRKPGWEYYYPPFAKVENAYPGDSVREVELNLLRASYLGYPSQSDPNNWYVAVSPSPEVNLYSLGGVCDKNIDALLEGNFCKDCLPSKTYTGTKWLIVDDRNLCAFEANVYTIRSYLLEWNGVPVYLSPVEEFEMDGVKYNFAFIISASDDLYLYLTRKSTYCGDGVCDPGEEANCPDCVSLHLSVSPLAKEANLSQTVSFTLDVVNDGDRVLDVYLSIDGPTGICNLARNELNLSPGASLSQLISCSSEESGTFTFRVKGTVGGVEVFSNPFTLVVVGEEKEGEVGGGGGGGVPPPQVEENRESRRWVSYPRGIYIPELNCISYLHLFAPDALRVAVGEERNVYVVVSNLGSCEEDLKFYVEGVEENMYRIQESNFHLKPKEVRRVLVTFRGAKPGSYAVNLVLRGHYTQRRKMTLVVRGVKHERRACSSNMVLLAPDVVELVEGEDVNSVLEIRNEGTCTETVAFKLYRKRGELTLLVDGGSHRLPKGEKFVYRPPKLAAGEYVLHVEAGNLGKDISIVVRPRSSVESVVEEIVIRARLALLVIILLILLGTLSYIRRRYLS